MRQTSNNFSKAIGPSNRQLRVAELVRRSISDILRKNDEILEVVLEDTTIKIFLKKKGEKYIGYFKDMEFESDG